MDKIYLVVEGYYSDWNIIGYYTNKNEAEKFCATNREKYDVPYFVIVNCMDGSVNVSNVSLKYEHQIVFDKTDNGWQMRKEPERYDYYIADFERSNSMRGSSIYRWIEIKVNQTKFNRAKAEKIAQDYLYQYLNETNGKIVDSVMNEFNAMWKEPERAREKARKEKELKEKELAELARLKAKYESE